MIGVLLISHEPLGTALLRCTRHIYGRLPPQVAALDVIPDEDPEGAFQAAHELAARINDGSGVLVLTDVFGATPSRIASRLIEPFRIEVVAGVNLPMLCRALTYRRQPLEELVPLLIEGGHAAIQVVPPQTVPAHATPVLPAQAAQAAVPAPRPAAASAAFDGAAASGATAVPGVAAASDTAPGPASQAASPLPSRFPAAPGAPGCPLPKP